MKAIGVIGGMGPAATARFYDELIRYMQGKYKASLTNEFPEMYICNLPIPDIVCSIADEGKTRSMLMQCAKNLESCGCSFICMPCNTATKYIKDIRDSVNVPVMSIIDEVCAFVKNIGIRKAGILATKATVQGKIYQSTLLEMGIKSINPTKNQLDSLTDVICNMLAGNQCMDDIWRIQNMADDMRKKGANCIILGCTELPLLALNVQEILAIDSIKILAMSAVRYSKGAALPKA